jgi:hypothetical protein
MNTCNPYATINLWPNENLRARIIFPFLSLHSNSALSQRPHCTDRAQLWCHSFSYSYIGQWRQTWLHTLGWKILQFNLSHKQINQRKRTCDRGQTYGGVTEQVQIYGGDSAVCSSGSMRIQRFQRSADGRTLQNDVNQQPIYYKIVRFIVYWF